MNKLFEVREYDTIVGNGNYSEDPYYKYLPAKVFADLEDFIHSYSDDEESSDVLDFLKIGYKRNIGDTISVKNYVGLIQMKNGYQIQILPKIDLDAEDENLTETKKIFMRMLKSMRDFPGKVFNEADIKSDRMNLYEIFISMFIKETRQLLKSGLKSAYIPKEENSHFYKGKFVVSENIKKNFAHKERFYILYDEYQVNRPENRLVKATLIKLHSITSSIENNREIKQVLSAFEMVQASVNYEKDFARVAIDRSTKQYEPLLKWARVFLLNKSFTSFSGETSARALMFPMEKVFESYVAMWAKRIFREAGWNVRVQDRGYYLFDSSRRFALRPDIVVDCGKGRRIIMDTKWKRLVDAPSKNYGISQADMYQMYAYAKKYEDDHGIPEIWLLYPKHRGVINCKGIRFESDDSVKVNVFFIDVANIEASIIELKDAIIEAGIQ